MVSLAGWFFSLICNFETYPFRGMKFNQPKVFYLLIGLLFLLNFVQSYFTDLIYDEAYYWYYAKEMAWGYFDHPPMVALLVKLSGLLFDGELGVRFMSCLLWAGMVFIIWQCIEHPKKDQYIPQYFLLVFSMTLVNAYGFFTLPDTPMLFFLALFLWAYKHFIKNSSLQWALLMGFSMACLMYSKYHAALIILFVLFSNIRLMRNKFAWLALFTSLVLYLPHLNWLYENDFVSIKYHIFERPNRAYEFADFTLGFFVNLIILFGLTFPWIYRSLFKTKPGDLFTRALLFIVYGFIVFFFLSSFSRRIQTQWLIAICIPLVIISYNYMLKDPSIYKWLMRAAIANAIILLYLRVGLAYAPLFPIHYESHGNEDWVQELAAKIGDKPVVFESSYRRAPMYEFYSGNISYSLNDILYRRNQYSIDNSEARVQKKDILFVSKFFEEGDIYYDVSYGRRFFGKNIEKFESFRKLRCEIDPEMRTENLGERVFRLYNPYPEKIALSKLKFNIVYLNKYRQYIVNTDVALRPLGDERTYIGPDESIAYAFMAIPPDTIDPTYYKISISENNLPFGLNGNNAKLKE